MKKTIKCLMHYVPTENEEYRRCSLAAAAKAEYLFSCFQRLGYRVEILSACPSEQGSAKGGIREIFPGIILETLPCLGRGNGVKNALSTVSFRLTLWRRLWQFVREGDVLWVYHSLPLMRPIRILKRFRKFRLLLELEELYGDVLGAAAIRNRELRFARLADGFLFPVRELERTVNRGGKPAVICYGPYRFWETGMLAEDTIHVVYAGSALPEKGVFLAMDAAEHLPEGYHVHILTEDTPQIRSHLARKQCRCRLTFDGLLTGQAFPDFLGTCRVGLCTQSTAAAFNETSFPSKILTYLGAGLQVVCGRIPAVEHSDVGRYLRYYEEESPRAVAEAILRAAEESDTGKQILRTLDASFRKAVEELLETLG